MENKKQLVWRYGFAFILLVFGIILSFFNMDKEFLGFSSISTWLIYVALVMFAVITLQIITKKKKLIDERMEFIAAKAGRVTFVGIIIFAFTIMVIDGLTTITIPYSYFMSYFICGILVFYTISYKLLLKFN